MMTTDYQDSVKPLPKISDFPDLPPPQVFPQPKSARLQYSFSLNFACFFDFSLIFNVFFNDFSIFQCFSIDFQCFFIDFYCFFIHFH